VNLAPAAGDLFENQQSEAVESAVLREDFAHAVAVEVQLLDVVNARKKFLRRRLVRLELYKVRAKGRALRFRNQKQIAIVNRRASQHGFKDST
jgi:hypothetical protein